MKCKTEGCTNKADLNRKECGKCRSKKHREKYPLKYWYDTLKMNAKRRRKEFTLTLKEFEQFCIESGYNERKGKTADSLSVDRIKDYEGYSADNIRAITLSKNTQRRYDPSVVPEDNCPF